MTLCVFFTKMAVGDWINVIDIIISTSIGIWLAVSVNKSLTRSRFLKEYLIKEVDCISDDYNQFYRDLFAGKLSARYIKDWFKIMSLKISNLEESVTKNFQLKKNKDITERHSEIRNVLTSSDEFNDQYKNNSIVITEETRKELIKNYSELSNSFLATVIDINTSRKRRK